MPDDTYCSCGDAADFTLTTGDNRTQTLCSRCTVQDVRDQLPPHITVHDIDDDQDENKGRTPDTTSPSTT